MPTDDTRPDPLRVAGVHERTTKPTIEPDPDDPTKVRQTAYCQWCAEHRPDEDPRWPCETARLLRRLATSGAVTLDVERLARATATVSGYATAFDEPAADYHRTWARHVATEYARLSGVTEGADQ